MGKVIKGVVKTLTFGTIGGALLRGGKKKTAPAPAPEPPVMPLADDEAVQRARRNAIARRMSAGGRSSTILTGSGDSLGGGYG